MLQILGGKSKLGGQLVEWAFHCILCPPGHPSGCGEESSSLRQSKAHRVCELGRPLLLVNETLIGLAV